MHLLRKSVVIQNTDGTGPAAFYGRPFGVSFENLNFPFDDKGGRICLFGIGTRFARNNRSDIDNRDKD